MPAWAAQWQRLDAPCRKEHAARVERRCNDHAGPQLQGPLHMRIPPSLFRAPVGPVAGSS
jgi:hypothetical protein